MIVPFPVEEIRRLRPSPRVLANYGGLLVQIVCKAGPYALVSYEGHLSWVLEVGLSEPQPEEAFFEVMAGDARPCDV